VGYLHLRRHATPRTGAALRCSFEAKVLAILSKAAAQNFLRLQTSFRQMAICEVVWHIEAAGRNADTKRNAGACTNLQRKVIRPVFSWPPRMQCNLEVPTLKAGKATLYFFPDRLLVYDSVGVGAVPYSDLKLDAQESRFVESERVAKVAKDSRQVGTIWQYVNKKGGPDRRFANNRQFPVMQYGVIAFSSNSGLVALFMCSRPDVALLFKDLPQLASHALHATI
jgi:hypothetical protein